jgi:heterodisulfide reductase subunit A
MDRCIACGTCAEKCPRKVDDAFNEKLIKRKAAYVAYAQAVPLKYAIDGAHCIYLQKKKCRACEKFCPTKAVHFDDREETRTIRAGAVILAPGFGTFDPGRYHTYKYAGNPNVVTSSEFERILSATGPYQGHLRRPSDGREPGKIAWLQCIGSRDLHRCDRGYCSSVCCMYAIKEATVAKEHAGNNLDCAVFYMDIRTHGKDFDRYLNSAMERQGIRFIRTRVPTVESVEGRDDLVLPYVNGKGEIVRESFDMVVLSVGLETTPEAVDLAGRLGIDLTEGRFCRTGSFHPVETSRRGIYVCGAFQGPKDIPQSVMEASAAACAATEGLAPARHSRTRVAERQEETDVRRQPPRIGVFVCNCGINIGGVVRIPEVAAYAGTLPHVEYVEENLFTCSQDTQDKMAALIKEKGLNRIVVAACTPRTHEGLFQETLMNAGLNKYLLEMANIRNHDAWVHASDPDGATKKACDLVRMAAAKAALMEPLQETELEVNQRALVLGGGISGLTAARSLSGQGYRVSLVERSASLGGQALNLFKTWKGEDIQKNLAHIIRSVESDPNIDIYLNAELGDVEGFVGNFRSRVSSGGREEIIEHGVTLLATGAREHRPEEYLYGRDPRVVTHLDLDRRFIKKDPSLKAMKTAVFIQCVGSRELERPYCSRVCCTHSVESALHLKALNPSMRVYVLYRDIRTYGERETLYRKARLAGVTFIQFSVDDKPRVSSGEEGLTIEVRDPVLDQGVEIRADLLALATGVEAHKDERVGRLFKVPCDSDGWLLEAHQKLRPVDCSNEGVFLCGMAHYPKPIDESVAQAQAAASRALTLLAKGSIHVGGIVSCIEPTLCSGCLGCVRVCPFGAISFNEEKKIAEVNEALCKGCGACGAACPSQAPVLKGFDNRQLYAQIKSALAS